MIRIIVLIILSQTSLNRLKCKSIQQEKQLRKQSSPYNMRDLKLITELKSLKYDSAKLFYFNEEKNDVADFSLKVDNLRKIYNIMGNSPYPDKVIGSLTNDKGRLLLSEDDVKFINILKKTYKDHYKDMPVSPYIPTMGIVFFRDGVASAHVDVSFITGSIQFEALKKGKIAYRYNWVVVGGKTIDYMKSLAQKYDLPGWVSSPY